MLLIQIFFFNLTKIMFFLIILFFNFDCITFIFSLIDYFFQKYERKMVELHGIQKLRLKEGFEIFLRNVLYHNICVSIIIFFTIITTIFTIIVIIFYCIFFLNSFTNLVISFLLRDIMHFCGFPSAS